MFELHENVMIYVKPTGLSDLPLNSYTFPKLDLLNTLEGAEKKNSF